MCAALVDTSPRRNLFTPVARPGATGRRRPGASTTIAMTAAPGEIDVCQRRGGGTAGLAVVVTQGGEGGADAQNGLRLSPRK